jgi:hypothetical protein
MRLAESSSTLFYLWTGLSPPVALHPASRRRSYLQLRTGQCSRPERTFTLLLVRTFRRTSPAPSASGRRAQGKIPRVKSQYSICGHALIFLPKLPLNLEVLHGARWADGRVLKTVSKFGPPLLAARAGERSNCPLRQATGCDCSRRLPGRLAQFLYGEKEFDINLAVRKIRVIKLLL